MKTITAIVLAGALCAAALAQQFKFDLDRLAAKASNAVDVSLNGQTLQFAAKFLEGSDPEEAAVKKLIAGLEGIYVKSFEFRNPGEYSQADLDQVRAQLRAPEWSRAIGVKSAQEGETVDVFLHMENGKITGVAILAAEPRELTVVNIVGPVDLDALAQLGGHFGVPKVSKKKDSTK